MARPQKIEYPQELYTHRQTTIKELLKHFSKKDLLEDLEMMFSIRQFETRAKNAYLEGMIGGFFHSYAGEEASGVGVIRAFGKKHPYTTTYRCHGIALALGVDPNSAMAELFGKKTGLVGGRGGSMHFHYKKDETILTGGFGIVGGHLAIAAGASFALKYEGKEAFSICFLGDGAVAQGLVHEVLNLSMLMGLQVLLVIENNTYSMGTHVERGICFSPLSKIAQTYGAIEAIVDGHHYPDVVMTFRDVKERMKKEGKPAVVEVLVDRYEGHSMSDSMPYRSASDIESLRSLDPIFRFASLLQKEGLLSDKECMAMQERAKKQMMDAIEFAKNSPDPDPVSIGEGVFAT